ncbi:hypothetical protein HPO96_33905 [Kribbella sandramycini]|uniref:Mce-associated membrane protein n=1 Tax=Kribbella sandramycini TaxID=60450 RepID=A0A7Y4L6E2_9ACTN|nr:hypothetical protein [Kribbella sandramycini]MBB6570393.1 hypothetical protein [Kribbella sandramycini]NOL45255.1 hypothetical protein [Kribbella sandramycini]
MRIRNLAVTALVPAMMLAGCGNEASSIAASSPGAQKASKQTLTEQVGAPVASADPVVNAYYDYRVALDQMMRSGGAKTEQLRPVMTANLFQSISVQAKYYRSKRLRNTGATTVLWAKRTLASNGVIVTACYDTSAARTVDSSNQSVLPADIPTRWLDQMRVKQQNTRWIVDGGSTKPTDC